MDDMALIGGILMDSRISEIDYIVKLAHPNNPESWIIHWLDDERSFCMSETFRGTRLQVYQYIDHRMLTLYSRLRDYLDSLPKT